MAGLTLLKGDCQEAMASLPEFDLKQLTAAPAPAADDTPQPDLFGG